MCVQPSPYSLNGQAALRMKAKRTLSRKDPCQSSAIFDRKNWEEKRCVNHFFKEYHVMKKLKKTIHKSFQIKNFKTVSVSAGAIR